MGEPRNLASIGADVDWPDSETSTAVRARLAGRTGLGHLAGIAEWVAGVRPANSTYARVRVVVVGADVDPLVADTAPAVGAEVQAVPADGDVNAGVALADDLADRGTDLVVLAVPHVAADAAVAVSVLTNTEPAKVLARGAAATDPNAWMDLAAQVRDTRRRCMPHRDDPDALLAEIGGSRLAVAAGLALQSAVRRTPVLLDGPAACAAALVAYEAQPRAVRWWGAADLGEDPLQELALTRLGQQAVLGLGSGLGDGLAGLLAVPIIRAALRISLPAPDSPPD